MFKFEGSLNLHIKSWTNLKFISLLAVSLEVLEDFLSLAPKVAWILFFTNFLNVQNHNFFSHF